LYFHALKNDLIKPVAAETVFINSKEGLKTIIKACSEVPTQYPKMIHLLAHEDSAILDFQICTGNINKTLTKLMESLKYLLLMVLKWTLGY
jgi:hypothetical protein